MNEIEKLQKQQHNLSLIIWGAILFSNIIFFVIFTLDLLQTKGLKPSENLASIIPYCLALVTGFMSFMIYRGNNHYKCLHDRLEKISNDPPKDAMMTPAQFEDFNKLSNINKKKHVLNTSRFTFTILGVALAESVNIFGVSGPFMGMPREHYYFFFIAAILLVFLHFPKKLSKILN